MPVLDLVPHHRRRRRHRPRFCDGRESSLESMISAPTKNKWTFSRVMLLSGLLFISQKNCSCFFVPLSKTNRRIRNDKIPVHDAAFSSSPYLSSMALRYANSTITESIKQKQDDGRSDEIVKTITDYYLPKDDGQRLLPKRGNIQLVAGSGKTYIAWKVMENLLSHLEDDDDGATRKTTSDREKSVVGGPRAPRIGVFVTPYLNLVDQALNDKDEHNIMTATPNDVAVDTMILASSSSRKQERCSTDVNEIQAFLTDDGPIGSQGKTPLKIFVTTYRSLHKLGDVLNMLYPRDENDVDGGGGGVVDFAVFDEAHKMEGLGSGSSGNTDTAFFYGLYDSNIGIQNRLFMSGTPNNFTQTTTVVEGFPSRPAPNGARVFIPKNNKGADDEERGRKLRAQTIRSFRDEALFGPCLARKSHQESVEQNVTLPISLYGVEIDVFREYDDDSDGTEDGTEKDYYLPAAIQSAFHKLGIKHVVSFHSTNQRAREFMESTRKVFAKSDSNDETISLFNMDCTTKAEEREEILYDAQSASRSLITNCKLLSMGVDAPWLDLVVIADPVTSSVAGMQMIGRVGRKAPGKERGYVLVPVPSGNEDKMVRESEAYDVFVNTFNHMVSLDPELQRDVLFVIEKSSELGRSLERSEYPERVLEAFIFPPTMKLESKNWLMKSAIVDYSYSLSSRWDGMYASLAKYKEREGDCNVPGRHVEDGEMLGSWLSRQRANKKNGSLDNSLEERLTNLGVVWDVFSQQWENNFKLLEQYKEREGDCDVPHSHVEDSEHLGAWLSRQRRTENEGSLDKSLEERLTNLGVVWDVLSQKWEANFKLLVQYKKREGDCNVPQSHLEDGENLGAWLSRQRRSKNERSLDKSLEGRLTNLGVVWDVLSQQWEVNFQLLVKYNEREGGCNVPTRHIEDGEKLGAWLTRQRTTKNDGSLEKSLEERLTNLGVVWDLVSQQWEDNFQLLVQYKQREGDCNVPQRHVEDGENLGTWLVTQRTTKNEGGLDKSLEERLTNLGVVWDLVSQKWENKYKLLEQYKEREGDCNVPRSHVEGGVKLGSWLTKQRRDKKNRSLDENLEERLTNLGVVWDVFSQQWEDKYKLLEQYKEREGDCNVPRSHVEDGVKLGKWLTKQSGIKKNGSLDENLEGRLTNLGVVWDVLSQQWEDNFQLLVQYKEREGDCNVPYSHVEGGEKLGRWLSKQRTKKKNGKLDKRREERLNNLGGEWKK